MTSKAYQAYIASYRHSANRRQLLRWSSWFFCINTILLLLVSLRYFTVIEMTDDTAAQVFSIMAFVGHFAFVTFMGFLFHHLACQRIGYFPGSGSDNRHLCVSTISLPY